MTDPLRSSEEADLMLVKVSAWIAEGQASGSPLGLVVP